MLTALLLQRTGSDSIPQMPGTQGAHPHSTRAFNNQQKPRNPPLVHSLKFLCGARIRGWGNHRSASIAGKNYGADGNTQQDISSDSCLCSANRDPTSEDRTNNSRLAQAYLYATRESVHTTVHVIWDNAFPVYTATIITRSGASMRTPMKPVQNNSAQALIFARIAPHKVPIAGVYRAACVACGADGTFSSLRLARCLRHEFARTSLAKSLSCLIGRTESRRLGAVRVRADSPSLFHIPGYFGPSEAKKGRLEFVETKKQFDG
ncbi:hypothetical protein EI94DRAFT_1699477 [Lactarius quietus]|nr:hypothetical protein EI94DRAFT_1699477 [Lactarius quietus]